MRTRVTITDWDGDEDIVTVVYTDHKNPGICFDGGRIDIGGVPETQWVMSHRWKIDFEEE